MLGGGWVWVFSYEGMGCQQIFKWLELEAASAFEQAGLRTMKGEPFSWWG